MDYQRVKMQLFYSDIMRALDRYPGTSLDLRNWERRVESPALFSDINSDYCSVLTLLTGFVKYYDAIKKDLKNATVSDKPLRVTDIVTEILGEPPEDRLVTDLTKLQEYNGEEPDDLSDEARIVAYAKDALDLYSTLTRKEQEERLGGSVGIVSMCWGIKKGPDGRICKGEDYRKIEKMIQDTISERKNG